jgi:hypothetical protein
MVGCTYFGVMRGGLERSCWGKLRAATGVYAGGWVGGWVGVGWVVYAESTVVRSERQVCSFGVERLSFPHVDACVCAGECVGSVCVRAHVRGVCTHVHVFSVSHICIYFLVYFSWRLCACLCTN